MRFARFVVLPLLVVSAAFAEERQVWVRLSDGTEIQGTLVEFGSRTYQFRINGEIVTLKEDQIAEIDFRPQAEAPVAVAPPKVHDEGVVRVKDVDLRVALEALAKQHGLSLVLGPQVRGTISFYTPDAAPRAVIEAFANACNFRVDESNGILTLTPAVIKLPRFVPPAGAGSPATLDVKDADIRQVLPLLAKAAGCSVVYGPAVRGTVSLQFNGVPAFLALESAAEAVSCGLFQTKDGILIIIPALPRDRTASTSPQEVADEIAALKREMDLINARLAALQAENALPEALAARQKAEADLARAQALFAQGVIEADQVIEAKGVILDAKLAAGFIPPEEWNLMRRQLLEEEERRARARLENGIGSEIDAIRATFRVVQFRHSLGEVTDEELEKVCKESLAREKAIRETQLKSGMYSAAELAKQRLEMLNAGEFYRALPKAEMPAGKDGLPRVEDELPRAEDELPREDGTPTPR